MGAPVVTIDRAVSDEDDAPRTPGGAARTGAPSTPTFLSTESLTFPGVSLMSLGFVQVWNKATGTPATPTQIALMAAALGVVLIAWGLLGPTNELKSPRNVVGQVLIGALNTVLLYGVMLGVAVA